jgi:hypothetical protein
MHQSTAALVMAPIALIEGWSLLRAWRTGKISSRGWTVQRQENPVGFWTVAAVDVCILAGIGWFALYMIGMVGGPPASIAIPRFG